MEIDKTLLRCRGVLFLVLFMGSMLFGVCSVTAAPALEPTDSGAPSAMVLFPVTDKAEPVSSGMRPVVFNHLVHEKKVQDCESCHHTGDMVTCSSCHTVEGKEEGNFITLERAMHAENIMQRAEGTTPSSCVSCHVQNLQRLECAGCHSLIPEPVRSDAYCNTCHNITSSMTDEQWIKGSKGQLSAEENEALAAETLSARQQSLQKPVDLDLIPNRVTIDALAKTYEPTLFLHARHYTILKKGIEKDKLAAAFHTSSTTLCMACHHQSPPSLTPPTCISCHSSVIDTKQIDRPALTAAYHLQCMGCHDAMQVTSPKKTSCVSCHRERSDQ